MENPDPDFSAGEDLERWREQIVPKASVFAFQKTIIAVIARHIFRKSLLALLHADCELRK